MKSLRNHGSTIRKESPDYKQRIFKIIKESNIILAEELFNNDESKNDWCIFREIYGCNSVGCSSIGAVSAKNMSMDSDIMDQLSADDRHVRNGTDTETGRLQNSISASEKHHSGMYSTIHDYAAAGIFTWKYVFIGNGSTRRRDAGRDLSGRYFQQCNHVSQQR